MENLTAKVKAYLKAGDRETAGKFAIELKGAQAELEENKGQLDLHEKSYENNVKKIQHATKRLGDVRYKIQKYDADLKMSEAEAEVSQLAQNFNFDITTDFGQLEQVIQGEDRSQPGPRSECLRICPARAWRPLRRKNAWRLPWPMTFWTSSKWKWDSRPLKPPGSRNRTRPWGETENPEAREAALDEFEKSN